MSWLEIEHARFLSEGAEPSRPGDASEIEAAAVEMEQPS